MTIKQNGGIFGRNPTFNDVTVDGTLTASTVGLDGAVTVNESGASVNFRVEGNTDTHLIFTDGTNDRVGLGTDNTQLFNAVGGNSKLVVTGDNNETNVAGNRNASITIANADGTANNTAGLHFAREDDDGAPNYAGASIVAQFPQAQVSGQYPQGQLVFLTSSVQNASPSEKLRILAGGGITFNGDTAAANALDDYEEGTWTPVVADASSGGNTSASVFTGDYTKVGNLVFVNCSLVDIDTTGLTAGNDLYIQGLPFTPKSGTLFAGSVFGRVTISGKWCTAAISTSAAIRLEDNPGTTSNPSRVPVSGIVDDGGDLRISITYIEA
jgi:hypothetical protein